MLPLILAFVARQGEPVTVRWRLHKFEQPIGWETASTAADGDGTKIDTDFSFVDRSSPVHLKAQIRLAPDGSYRELTVTGQTSRMSTIGRHVAIEGREAKVTENRKDATVPVPATFVISPGYSPLAAQEAMLRYWRSHGQPKSLPNLPNGEVRIESRGPETFVTKNRGNIRLTRYTVGGVMWGEETLWADDSGRLIAGVMCDAEFDHFEAVAEGYEDQIEAFIRSAASDSMVRLRQRTVKSDLHPGETLALEGGRLVDGTGRAPIEDATLVVRDGKIVGAGSRASIKIPANARRIDVRGKTIMPGLWDMHAHFEQVDWGAIYLASGVTTVRDCGNEFEFITAVRDAIDAGKGLGPRLILAGLVDGSSPMALGTVRVDIPQEVKAAVEKYKRAGFKQIKIYSSVKPDMVRAVAEEAHRQGLTVTGHIPEGMTIQEGIGAGMDQVSHFQYVVSAVSEKGTKFRPLDPNSEEVTKLIDLMRAKHTVLDDTMALFHLFIHGPVKGPGDEEPGALLVAPELRTAVLSQIGAGSEPLGKLMDSWLAVLGRMHRAGIPIVAGTDQAIPGHSLHKELELYVQAGFSPLEAIQAATSVPAKAMGMDREVGTLESGKRADILVVDGNPLARISDTRNVFLVLAKGQPYSPAPLWRSVGFEPPQARP